MSEALRMEVPRDVLSKEALLKLPVKQREQYVKKVIREVIHKNDDGVTLQMLTERLPFDKRTIAKYLAIMEFTNEVWTRLIGSTTVYLPNGRLIRPTFEETFPLTDKELKISVLRNRLGEFVFIQENRKGRYADESGSGILIPRPAFKDFVRFLRDVSNSMGEN